jgi:hypothetical protein
MPTFDPDRTYSEVHGMPGIKYVQDGHAFDPAGNHVPNPPEEKVDPPPADFDKDKSSETWPQVRLVDGAWTEPPAPVILGPDGLPAQRVEADEEHVGPSITSVPIQAPGQPPPAELQKDDMRLKENRMLKAQWEQWHEGEDFPGVAEARRILGAA